MSDTNATPEVENAFEAPKAELTNVGTDKPILEMERFSTWAVVGLTIITFGIYYLYWMYTRMNQINGLSTNAKGNKTAFTIYIGIYVVNTAISISGTEDLTIAIVNLVLSLCGVVALLITVFSTRRAIIEVINKGSAEQVHLGGVMTFFFQIFYFQYKINEAIDNQSN